MRPFGHAYGRWGITPLVTFALIGINIVVFLYQLTLSDLDQHIFILKHGLIPAELTSEFELTRRGTVAGPVDLTSPFGTWATIFTSMFVHAGVFHVAGNMLFLWVLGDNVEYRLGRIRFLLFYFTVGFAAAWTQVGVDTGSQVPMVGASGAIAGLLGAYLLIYPFGRVPALYLVGAWFIFPLLTDLGGLNVRVIGGGVAYFAHIGGFVAGLLLVAIYKLLTRQPLLPQRPGRYLRY